MSRFKNQFELDQELLADLRDGPGDVDPFKALNARLDRIESALLSLRLSQQLPAPQLDPFGQRRGLRWPQLYPTAGH